MLLSSMSHLRFFFLLILLLATGCDQIKDEPRPNLLENLVLRDVQLDVQVRGRVVIDLLRFNAIPEESVIRMVQKPVHGSIFLDPQTKMFIYQPDSNWIGGLDSVRYEVCNAQLCKPGRIRFRVSDSCRLAVSDFAFTLASSATQLPLPAVFSCNGRISQLLNMNSPYLVLQNGMVLANFPLYESQQLNFSIVVCTPYNQCDTAQVQLQVQGQANPCLALFKPVDDVRTIFPNILAFSMHYDSLLTNDASCPQDIIPASLTVVEGPTRGHISYRSNVQGRFLRYTKDSNFVSGVDSLTYRISGISGASGQAKVFIKIKN